MRIAPQRRMWTNIMVRTDTWLHFHGRVAHSRPLSLSLTQGDVWTRVILF